MVSSNAIYPHLPTPVHASAPRLQHSLPPPPLPSKCAIFMPRHSPICLSAGKSSREYMPMQIPGLMHNPPRCGIRKHATIQNHDRNFHSGQECWTTQKGHHQKIQLLPASVS
jgi:hypothetical protein